MNRIQLKLAGSKFSTPSTKFVFFRVDKKKKMAAPATDWLKHFRLLLWNHWTEFNETWQEARSQRRLPSLCFPPWPILKKGGTLYSGARYVALWASCFCNHCMAFIKTWQEANTSSLLQSLCFLDLYVNKNGKPDLWLADTFSILLLQLLCKFEQNIYIFTFREGNMGSLNTLVFLCFQYQAFS